MRLIRHRRQESGEGRATHTLSFLSMSLTWILLFTLLLSTDTCHSYATTDASVTESGPRMVTRVNHRNETYVLLAHESEKASFVEADIRCSVIGSMVWVRDDADQRFLQSLADGHSVWLGCQFTQGLLAQRRLTVTDSLSRDSSFENWKRNEPRCSAFGECCAIIMDTSGKWQAQPCASKAHILCRVKNSFQSEAQKLIQDTRSAVVAIGGTVPPEAIKQAITENVHPESSQVEETLSNLTQRITALEQKMLSMSRTHQQVMEERHKQSMEHSDRNTRILDQKITNVIHDFKGTIESLSQLIARSKKH